MYTTVQPSPLYEQIATQIQNRILGGDLNPGDQLPPERELVEQFGVSRTAVREAVKVLREKGFVEIRPGKGTFVADIANSTSEIMREKLGLLMKVGLNDVADLIQVRIIIEPEIAAIAAEMATDEDIQAMQQAIDIMDAALDSVDLNLELFVEADLKFHHALAHATQNALIPVLLHPIVDFFREQLILMGPIEGAQQRGQYHHKRILKAVTGRDPIAARQAMMAHLKQVREDVLTVLNPAI